MDSSLALPRRDAGPLFSLPADAPSGSRRPPFLSLCVDAALLSLRFPPSTPRKWWKTPPLPTRESLTPTPVLRWEPPILECVFYRAGWRTMNFPKSNFSRAEILSPLGSRTVFFGDHRVCCEGTRARAPRGNQSQTRTTNRLCSSNPFPTLPNHPQEESREQRLTPQTRREPTKSKTERMGREEGRKQQRAAGKNVYFFC